MSDLHNQAAEAGVICAALHSPRAQSELLKILKPDDFYLPAHEAIWDTVHRMSVSGQLVDPITIVSGLAKHSHQRFQSVLVEIVALGTVDVQGTAYASEVKDLATRRRLSATGVRIQQLAGVPEETPKNLAALAMSELETAYRPIERSMTHVGDTIDEFLADLADPTVPQGIRWPYADTERILKPLAPGQLVLVAGRPAMGKSVALADIARSAAIRDGHTTIVFSLEMRSNEYLRRIMSAESGVALTALQEKTLTTGDWNRVETAQTRIRNSPLHIIDDPECTTADIRAAIKDLKADLVCFDYIQLGTFNPKISRREGLEEFSRGLKITANKLAIPIVAAAQLTRGSQDQRLPRISDLRESGALEQDADVICLLHREDYYDTETPRAGEIDLIVGKHRNGPTGTIALAHQFRQSRFQQLAH
jgi:replicative DNA helicase